MRESIRTLRTNLQFCGDDKRVILVTSCVPREGKSSVSVALAESIADMGKSVILVDADTIHIDEVHRALAQAVADGTITTERLNESVKRILLMKMQTQIDP